MSYAGVPNWQTEDVRLPDGTPGKRQVVTLAEWSEMKDLLEKLMKLQATTARQLSDMTGNYIDPDDALEESLL